MAILGRIPGIVKSQLGEETIKVPWCPKFNSNKFGQHVTRLPDGNPRIAKISILGSLQKRHVPLRPKSDLSNVPVIVSVAAAVEEWLQPWLQQI